MSIVADPLLVAEGVTKRFGVTVALDALDLAIGRGEFFALLGGSGSGKSTLLRLIAGFEQPDAGRLLLDGADLAGTPPWARPVNMMFQSYALFPHLSVFDNVAYGLRRAGVERSALTPRVGEALDMVGLTGLDRRRPHQLSGGQRQRVALARSLVMRPKLLLLDEPLGALDAGLRERTGFELAALQRQSGTAFVMVTHDQQEAMALADRIAILEHGRLQQVGPPAEVYARPASAFVARFLGAANVIEADGQRSATLGIALRAPAPARAYALRPERIRLAPAGTSDAPNVAQGIVREVAFRGDSALCVVIVGQGELRVSLPGDSPPLRGAAVTLAWDDTALVPLSA